MPNATTLPRVRRVRPAKAAKTLAVDWSTGERDIIDLTGLIARVAAFAPLEDAEIFATVEPVAFGTGIGWPATERPGHDALDYGADTLHRLAAEQRPMAGADVIILRKRLRLSVQEFADLLEVSLGTMKNYQRADRVPTPIAIALRAMAYDPTVLRAHFRPRKPGRPRKDA